MTRPRFTTRCTATGSPRSAREHRLTSLAFNLTGVDTVEEMGPFEIAPATQWDSGETFDRGMFPPRSEYPLYQERAVRKYPKMGDMSVRSALTIHRGHGEPLGTICAVRSSTP